MTKITPAARAKLRQLKLTARLNGAAARGLDEYVRENEECRRDLLGTLDLKLRTQLGIESSDPVPGLRKLQVANPRLFADLSLTDDLVVCLAEVQACIELGKAERERVTREFSASTELVFNLEQWVKNHG